MGIRRALVVTDHFLYESGAAAWVGGVLSEAGVEYAVYYNVSPNPTVQIVNECIKAAAGLQVDLLLALGGGSAIDTAKAVSIVAAGGGSVEQYEGCGPFFPSGNSHCGHQYDGRNGEVSVPAFILLQIRCATRK